MIRNKDDYVYAQPANFVDTNAKKQLFSPRKCLI